MSNCNNCRMCSGWRCNPGKVYLNQSAKALSQSHTSKTGLYSQQTQGTYSHSAYSAVNYPNKQTQTKYGGN